LLIKMPIRSRKLSRKCTKKHQIAYSFAKNPGVTSPNPIPMGRAGGRRRGEESREGRRGLGRDRKWTRKRRE
jgi:hypothetical protein